MPNLSCSPVWIKDDVLCLMAQAVHPLKKCPKSPANWTSAAPVFGHGPSLPFSLLRHASINGNKRAKQRVANFPARAAAVRNLISMSCKVLAMIGRRCVVKGRNDLPA
jgi:hypothetical protein